MKNKTLVWILSLIVSITCSCNLSTPPEENTIHKIQDPNFQPTIYELAEKFNKELLTRKYDVDLKKEEIQYYLDAYKAGHNRYPKEWMIKIQYEIHQQIRNELKNSCLDSESAIKQYKVEIDSLQKEGKMDDKKLYIINRKIDDLEKMKKENLIYLEQLRKEI